jgi:hypothetical protein
MKVKNKTVTYKIHCQVDIKSRMGYEVNYKRSATLNFKDLDKFNAKIKLLNENGEKFSATISTIEYLEFDGK